MIQVQNTENLKTTRLTCVVYGEPGVGKTRLVRTCPGKPLVISSENGLLSIKKLKVDYINVTNWDEMIEVVRYVEQPDIMAKYSWLYIDSITELGQRLEEVLNKKYPDPKSTRPKYGEYYKRMLMFVKKFRDMSHYNVVFTAQMMEKTKKENEAPKTRVSLVGRLCNDLPYLFDEFFLMEKVPNEKGEIVEMLRTEGTDFIHAKDRSGELSKPYEEANLAVIYNKITGNQQTAAPSAPQNLEARQ